MRAREGGRSIREREFREFPESDDTMSGEQGQQQQLVPGTEPWVYRAEVEMLNGHNGDVPPQPAILVVEEPAIEVVQTAAAPSGSGDIAPGGSWIFIQAPQYHWHTVASAADPKSGICSSSIYEESGEERASSHKHATTSGRCGFEWVVALF